MRFDAKDKIIISMYAEDPDVSQETIGKKVNLSQPSVAARIAKLKEAGALSSQLGINRVPPARPAGHTTRSMSRDTGARHPGRPPPAPPGCGRP